MIENSYSLAELSALTKIEARTIRSYIQQGLVRGPDVRGPKASYSDYHLKRLNAIRDLKEVYRLTMEEIRQVLMRAGDEDIQVMVMNHPFRSPSAKAEDAASQAPEARESPLQARIRRSRGRFGEGDEAPMQLREPQAPLAFQPPRPDFSLSEKIDERGDEAMAAGAAPSRASPLENLLGILREALKDTRVPRSAKAEICRKIEIVPDIQLEIRGEFTPAQWATVEQIADHIRAVLLGGA